MNSALNSTIARPCFVAAAALTLAGPATAQVTNLRITEVDPDANTVEVTNFGPAFTTTASRPFCHRLRYVSAIPNGTSFAAGQAKTFTVTALNNTDSDLWLYSIGVFEDADNIVHGLKYGPLPNIGRAGLASNNGLWSGAASFAPTPPNGMTLAYDGFGFGAGDWYIDQTPTLGAADSTTPGTVDAGLEFPQGAQNFEQVPLGDEVHAIDSWNVVNTSAAPGMFTVRGVNDVLGEIDAGRGDSTRWLRIRDQDAGNVQNRFYSNFILASEAGSYTWTFLVNLEQLPPDGGASLPRIMVQHADGGFVNTWGIEFAQSAVNLIVVAAGGAPASAELYTIESPTGVGDWVEFELRVDIVEQTVTARVNQGDPIALPINPPESLALSVFRLCYRGEGVGNVMTMLLDDVSIDVEDPPLVVCEGDVTGDNIVNVTDLLAVINNWGTDGSQGGDATGDGLVNVSDLLSVINNWGNNCGARSQQTAPANRRRSSRGR